MNFDLLNKMPSETLEKLQAMITEVMKSRFDTALRVGRVGSFTDTRDGTIRTARIDRVNAKTVSATEIEPTAGRKWRVSVSGFKIVPIERAKTLPMPKAVVPYKPTSVVGDSW